MSARAFAINALRCRIIATFAETVLRLISNDDCEDTCEESVILCQYPIRGGAENFSRFRRPTLRINTAISTHHDIARAYVTYFRVIQSSIHFNIKAHTGVNGQNCWPNST
eukprot:scaffold536225_cov23-Prasinocladus_malaysianus.AAC.1